MCLLCRFVTRCGNWIGNCVCCRQCDQGTTPLTECAFSDASRFDRLVVSDAQDALLCVCNSDASVATVYTASNVASIQLELSNIFNQASRREPSTSLATHGVDVRCRSNGRRTRTWTFTSSASTTVPCPTCAAG